MKTNEYIRDLIAEMQINDDPKHEDQREIDNMIHCDWDLPDELQDMSWVRPVRSTDPHDAVNTGSRILSTTQPIFRIHPVGPLDENRNITSEIERVLSWQYNVAARRTTNVTRDIVESALRYDEVCVHTIFLPWHKESVMASGGQLPPQWDVATRIGNYVILVENPQDVHYRYNFLGLECLALVKVMRAEDAYIYYKHPKILDDIKDRQTKESYITVFDYWDYFQRESFGYLHDEPVKAEAGGEPDYKFMTQKEMDLPFIPWSIKRGGTSLERNVRYQTHPLLAPMIWAKVWEDQNVAESLAFGESIAYAAAPRGVIENDYGEIVDIDYHQPNKPIRLRSGQKYIPIPPPEIDKSLLEIGDRLKARGDKATVARFLQNLDFPAGSAFATVNAVIKSATSALDPAKTLAEDTLADVAKNMLMYVHHTGEPIIGYEDNRKLRDMYGTQYEVTKDSFAPEALFIEVTLTASVPTDHQQRVNTAVMMQERLDWPKGRTYEFLDVPDGDIAMEERQQEMLIEQEFALAIKERQAEVDMAIQQQLNEQQMAMQARINRLQQGGPVSAAREGFANTGGTGFNPAQGGDSPMNANPEATRERVTGQDRQGESLA
jgi:hypothetical protein